MLFPVCENCHEGYERCRSDQRCCSSTCGQSLWKKEHPERAAEQSARFHTRNDKTCTKCGKTKSKYNFALRHEACRDVEARKSECNSCRNRRQKPHRKTFHLQRKEWIQQYWRSNPCIDCGETDLDVLEFDHRDPKEKAGLVTRMGSLKAVDAEAAKCDVRCANCHRRRHARERRANAVPKA